MADLYPVAGARIYIGAAAMDTQADDLDATDFASVSWTEIDGWTNAGAYGDAAEIIRTQLINRGRTIKQKGTRDAGQMSNQFAEINGDAGQEAMADAERSGDNFPFRVVYDDDDPAVTGTSKTTHYFVGLVTSWRLAGGGANTVRMRDATIEINSNIVEVPAA